MVNVAAPRHPSTCSPVTLRAPTLASTRAEVTCDASWCLHLFSLCVFFFHLPFSLYFSISLFLLTSECIFASFFSGLLCLRGDIFKSGAVWMMSVWWYWCRPLFRMLARMCHRRAACCASFVRSDGSWLAIMGSLKACPTMCFVWL